MTFEEWAKSKGHPFYDLEPTWGNGSIDRYSDIAREAWNAATIEEREACAKVCDNFDHDGNTDEYRASATWCAEVIRSRTE